MYGVNKKFVSVVLAAMLFTQPFLVSLTPNHASAEQQPIPKWQIHSGIDLLHITDEMQAEGNQSLRFEARVDSKTDIHSSMIDVVGNKEYEFSMQVNMDKNVSHSLGVYILSFNKDGKQIDSKRTGYDEGALKVGEWTTLTTTVTVPEDASTVKIRLYTGDPTTMIGYVDDIRFYELGDEGTKNEITVPNGSFEESENGSGDEQDSVFSPMENTSFETFDIPGWLVEDPSGGPYVTNEQSYTGDKSLKFVARAGSNTDVRTKRIPVEGDGNYHIKAQLNMTQPLTHTIGWYLYGYDKDGNEITRNVERFSSDDLSVNEWVEIEHDIDLSSEVTSLAVRIYTGNPTETVVFIDDLELYKADEQIALDNPGFEDALVVPEWHLQGKHVYVNGSESISGIYSMFMKGKNNEQVSMKSDPVPIDSGQTYSLSAYHLFTEESESANMHISFLDENEQLIEDDSFDMSNDRPGEWILFTTEKTAPDNATYAVIEINNGSGMNMEGYFDMVNISEEEPDDMAPDYPKTFANGDFEEVSEDGIPGWHVTESHDDSTVEVSTQYSYSGENSLYFHDNTADAGLRVSSDPVMATAGKTYVADVEAYIIYQSHRIVLELEFYDRNGQLLSKETSLFNNLPTEVWTTLPVRADAPVGTTYAQMNFYSGGVSFTEVYFDDATFSEMEQKEELVTNLGEPVEVGQPVKVPLAQGGIIGTTPEGDNEVYMVANGDPGVFHALDAETGALKFKEPLESRDSTVWAMTFGADDRLYFASESTGLLYRYDPVEKVMDDVGRIPSGDTKVWALTATEDGKIFGGTYPGADVFEYDIETGEFESFGRAHPDEEYVRGITATDTHVYAAIGSNKHLIKIDRKTKEKEELVIESDEYSDHQSGENGFYSDIWIIDGKLFIQSGSGNILVVEEDTLEPIQLFSVSDQISLPSPYDSDLIYFKADEELYTYNLTSNEVERVEGLPLLPDTPRVKSLEWIDLQDGEKAGRTVLAITTQYSEYFIYDPVDHTIEFIELDVEPQAVNIQSLETSNDNKIYIGGFQRGLSILNPENDEIEKTFGTFRQAEGIGFKDDIAYFGTYTGAQIYRYDPNEPDHFGSTDAHNPGFVYKVPDSQDRPFVVTSSDDHVFIGSVPFYGLLGGSLTIYDEENDSWESHRNVVENQSIIGLAYKDGLLYGGTSIWGGQGGSPEATEAKIFIWDVNSGEKIKEFTPEIPDIDQTPKMIGALSFGEDGLLWGAVDGTIFAMDPDTFEVVKSEVILQSTYSSSKWNPHYLRWGNDGLLYTTLARKLVVIDPDTLEHKVFDELGTVHNMTLADDGTVYYADANSTLYKLPVVKDNNADLKDLKINGDTIESFDPLTTDYEYLLPSGWDGPYEITAEPISDDAHVMIKQADGIPGTATIKVIAKDGRTTKIYKVHFSYEDPPPHDHDDENGDDGVTWLVGKGKPDAQSGANGDLYLDELTGDVYKKVDSVWELLGHLTDISDVVIGTDKPNSEDGATGDLYLNTSSGEVYQKSEEGWQLVGRLDMDNDEEQDARDEDDERTEGAKEEEKNGQELPKTATHVHLIILIGSVMTLAGGLLHIIRKRLKQSVSHCR